MDSLERRIIAQLLVDAGEPTVRVARKVKAARQTVSKKIKQLKRSGHIQRLTAVVDPEKFGLHERAFVFIQEDPEMKVRRSIEAHIDSLPNVTRFHRLFGRYSGILEVLTRDQDELSALVKDIHELEGMRETETFIVHSSVKDRPQDALIKAIEDLESKAP